MKKMHFLSAALIAVALSMGFTSCGNDDDEIDAPIHGEVIQELDKEISNLPVTNIKAADEYEHTGKISMHEGPISEVYIMADGKLLAQLPKNATRASSSDYIEGSYVVNPDGSITGTLAGYIINIASNKSEVIINDVAYAAEVAAATTFSKAAETLCRSWYPTEYNVVIYAGTKAVGCYKGSSLSELQRVVSSEIGTNVTLLAGEVNKIDFLNNGTIITNYLGNDHQIASWNWTDEQKGELSASFSSSDSSLIDIPAFVRFKAGTPNTCYLVSAFKVNATGKDNVPFQADMKVIITMKDAK